MKLSVIVPIYNAQETLRECLDSLERQTFRDMEVILMDNASTDESHEICMEYGFRYYRNRKNIGQGNNVNKGISLAKGEYVAECDSDDFVHAEMYEKLVENAEGCDVCQCGWWDVYPDYQIRRQYVRQKMMMNPMVGMTPKQRANFIIGQPHVMSAIYKKDFLTKNNIYYRDGVNFEDTSLCFKIRTTAKRWVAIPDCLYYYRKEVEGSGTKTIDDMESIFKQYEEMQRWNELYNLGLDKELAVSKYYSYKWAGARGKTYEDRKAFWKRARNEFRNDEVNPDFFFNEDDYKNYLMLRG